MASQEKITLPLNIEWCVDKYTHFDLSEASPPCRNSGLNEGCIHFKDNGLNYAEVTILPTH